MLLETPSVEATAKLVQDESHRYDVLMCKRLLIKVFGWMDKLRIDLEHSHND
jgi:hypothetical protein